MNIKRKKGIFFCVIAGLLWGTVGIFVKKISDFPPVAISFYRLLIAFIGMGVLATVTKQWEEVEKSRKDWNFFGTLAFLNAIIFIASVTGFSLSTVANVSILANTLPVFVPVAAFIVLGEKTTLKEWVGISIAMFGVLFIFVSDELSFSSDHFLGNLCALATSIVLAIYSVFARKVQRKYSFITLLLWVYGAGCIFVFLFGLSTGIDFWPKPSSSDILFLLGLSIAATLFGYTLYNVSLKYIKSSTAGVIALLSPISATVYAIFLLNELPSVLTVIGLICAFVGIYFVVSKPDYQKEKL